MDAVIRHQLGVLRETDGFIGELRAQHEALHREWMPSEIVPKDHNPGILPPETLAMLILNLLTEDGLPYFLSLLVEHLGNEGEMFEWSKRWTAEENRHATAIKYYARAALTSEQMVAVERYEMQYMQTGFWPDWQGQAYQLIGYVVMQEMATQLSHAHIAYQARHHDPVLHRMLTKIAGEEEAHHRFYLGVLKYILENDSRGVVSSLWRALRTFEMPGNAMPHFEDLAYLQFRTDVFGANELAKIVDHVIERLDLENVTGLSEEDEKARDKLCRHPNSLRRYSNLGRNLPPKMVALPFLGEGVSITI